MSFSAQGAHRMESIEWKADQCHVEKTRSAIIRFPSGFFNRALVTQYSFACRAGNAERGSQSWTRKTGRRAILHSFACSQNWKRGANRAGCRATPRSFSGRAGNAERRFMESCSQIGTQFMLLSADPGRLGCFALQKKASATHQKLSVFCGGSPGYSAAVGHAGRLP